MQGERLHSKRSSNDSSEWLFAIRQRVYKWQDAIGRDPPYAERLICSTANVVAKLPSRMYISIQTGV